MSKPTSVRARYQHAAKNHRRNFPVPALRLTQSQPEPPEPSQTASKARASTGLVLLRAFAQEIGTTPAALRQQICRGELRAGYEVFKPSGRWYIDREAFARRVRRHAGGVA